MTLNDIIVNALKQLDRGHDPQTLDTWRHKFTFFANDAAQELAEAIGLRRTDEAEITDGMLDLDTLPRTCEKVLNVTQDGKHVHFTRGGGSNLLRINTDGTVLVEYRYMPRQLSSPTDVPELPEHCHNLIGMYVVARERSAQDPNMQRGANVYFEMYQNGKAKLRKHRGEEDAYKILNRWE